MFVVWRVRSLYKFSPSVLALTPPPPPCTIPTCPSPPSPLPTFSGILHPPASFPCLCHCFTSSALYHFLPSYTRVWNSCILRCLPVVLCLLSHPHPHFFPKPLSTFSTRPLHLRAALLFCLPFFSVSRSAFLFSKSLS